MKKVRRPFVEYRPYKPLIISLTVDVDPRRKCEGIGGQGRDHVCRPVDTTQGSLLEVFTQIVLEQGQYFPCLPSALFKVVSGFRLVM